MQFLRFLLASARHYLAARKSTCNHFARHDHHGALTEDNRVGNPCLPPTLGRVTRLLLAPAMLATASMPLPAQDLIFVRGEYGSQATVLRLNSQVATGSPVISSALLAAIPDTDRVRGIAPHHDSASPAAIIYTERNDGTSHVWLFDYATGNVTMLVSPILWDGVAQTVRPEDMVGIARTPTGFLGVTAWHAIIGQSGTLRGPDMGIGNNAPHGWNSNGASGSLPFPGPYFGGSQHDRHAWVLTGTSTIRLKQSSLTGALPGMPGLPNQPTEVRSWVVPITGQVLGWTLSEEGYFYAVVNRTTEAEGPASGFVELVRSVQPVDLAVNTLPVVSVGGHIEDWTSDDNTPPPLPIGSLLHRKP